MIFPLLALVTTIFTIPCAYSHAMVPPYIYTSFTSNYSDSVPASNQSVPSYSPIIRSASASTDPRNRSSQFEVCCNSVLIPPSVMFLSRTLTSPISPSTPAHNCSYVTIFSSDIDRRLVPYEATIPSTRPTLTSYLSS